MEEDVRAKAARKAARKAAKKGKKSKKKREKKRRSKQQLGVSLASAAGSIDSGQTPCTSTIAMSKEQPVPESSGAADEYPFPVEEADHCETPPEAYHDIVPALRSLASGFGKTPPELRIYDPYYCAGGVKAHLAALGFTGVINRKEDCYRVWAEGRTPSFDVLLTNPPYSGDHVQKLFEFVSVGCGRGKPWLLLIPNYCATLSSYAGLEEQFSVVYAAPHKRYRYRSPPGSRGEVVKKEHMKTAPFVTLWFCGNLGRLRTNVLKALRNVGPPDVAPLVVASGLSELPANYRAARSKTDPTSIFCKQFGEFCASDAGCVRAASLGGYRSDRLCAMWALTGGCSCKPSSPFAHPLRVDTAALRRFVQQQQPQQPQDCVLPPRWPPLALEARHRPVSDHPGTACMYWLDRGKQPGRGVGRGGGGGGKRKGANDGNVPRWKRRR